MKLQGLDIVSFEKEKNLYSHIKASQSNWSKHHPFHWLAKAEQGDANSMIELGNIYLRDNNIVKARNWFTKAKGLSGFEEIAEERLKLTESINSRLNKNN